MGKSFDIIARPKKTRVNQPIPKNKKNSCLSYIIVLIILTALIYFARAQFKVNGDNKIIPKDMPSSANTAAITNYTPSPTASVNIKGTENTSNKTQEPATAIDKSQITIKILNGTGKNNAASQAQDELKKTGFKITETGTTKNIYANSIIYYNSSKEKEASLLSENIENKPKIEEDNNITNNFDLVYVIGKN